MHELVYNNPRVKPFERLYFEIFQQSLELSFDENFKPVGADTDGAAEGGGGMRRQGGREEGWGERAQAKSFLQALSCPEMFVQLNDGIVEAISAASGQVLKLVSRMFRL